MAKKDTLPILRFPEQTSELLSGIKSTSFRGLSVAKEKEIKHLLASVKSKREKYNALKQIDDVSVHSKVVKKELLETYALNSGCNVYDCENALFGLNNVDIAYRDTLTDQFTFQEKSILNQSSGPFLLTGPSGDVNFPPKLLDKKIQVLEATLALSKEKKSLFECIESCKLLAAKMERLLLLKNQTIMKLAETYEKGLQVLFLEVILIKYTILKDYFSEDPKVIEASYKLKEHVSDKLENLKYKSIELNKKIKAFKNLEGTNFNRLLIEYKVTRDSINKKEWTLNNLKYNIS